MLRCKRASGLFRMSFLLILLALFTTQCKEDDFTGEVVGVCPEVALTSPLNGAINVVTNKLVTATFNVAMDPSSINETSFVVKKSGNLVSGAVTYSGMTATFTPTDLLGANTVYSATITRAAKDPMGNIMRKDTTWSFNTGAVPIVVITDPAHGASDVALNKIITADFSTGMNASSINGSTFVVKQGANLVAGTVTYAGVRATFTPAASLIANKVYTATITTNAKDIAGNALAQDKIWSFATLTPIVQYTVSLSSLPADAGSTTGAGLFNAGSPVTVNATPQPGFAFARWTEGGVQVSTSASYTFGISNNRTLVANFTTIVSGPPGVDLGSAGNFAILAGSGVTNTGVSTIITGDVGSFPTATINGLLSGNVNGTLYTVADLLVGAAKNALTNAFNDAQGRSLDAISLPGQLGGLTLAPGLYVNSSTSGISGTGANGILTLDAGGNPNSVWIFKMGSTLITDAGTSIVLAGGAKAGNIYWSVGTSATLGTNSIFFGNILADQSITLTTGARLNGRALTRIGAVTLDTNTVTKP